MPDLTACEACLDVARSMVDWWGFNACVYTAHSMSREQLIEEIAHAIHHRRPPPDVRRLTKVTLRDGAVIDAAEAAWVPKELHREGD